MKITIMGCGRVGAVLAGLLDVDGHMVTVLDTDAYSFRRLPPTFGGTALIGSGTDEEALKKAGIQEASLSLRVPPGFRIKSGMTNMCVFILCGGLILHPPED